MQLSPHKEMAARREASAAISNTHQTDLGAGDTHPSADADPVEALRLKLARHGVAIATLGGSGLAISGPGIASRLLPDLRCGYILLRQLNAGQGVQ